MGSTLRAPCGVDHEYQRHILKGVSRTFALTIPTLPPDLCKVVGNGYLLCRIADTIEDEPALDWERKREFSEQFIDVTRGVSPPESFAARLAPLLSQHTLPAEHDLIRNTPSVIRMTRSFSPTQRIALTRCVRIMSKGMAEFQQSAGLDGLENIQHLDRYCYHVAGVVGEMLTDLFCEHVPEIRPRRDELMRIAVSFGQGLQMTNILKDIWDDYSRGVCWLPRDVFQQRGFDLARLTPGERDPRFAQGLEVLIGVAQMHLRNALSYTLSFPRRETGIRRFCLWALGMAILTLRKINANKLFTESREVKIRRSSVKLVVFMTTTLAGNDTALRALFDWFSRGLPQPVGYEGIASRYL